jgi:tetratricopeptide (TPR) repeat protein
MKTSSPSRIFVSYCRGGNGPRWKAWLVRHLAVFQQHHLLDVWEDGKIRLGTDWNDDIFQAMSSASLAIFLLAPEALKSKFILKTELPFLRDRWQQGKIPVFPVVCEPCRWKEQEQSRWLDAIQSPAGAEALSSFPDAIADRHLRDLATAIAQELSRVALHSLSASDVERARMRGALETKTYLDKFPLTPSTGKREEKLIGREQELALLDLAFAAQPHTAIVSLVAWGGVGKTMLVQHWLQRLRRDGWFGARRVYAWTFYSQGTREDRQASEDTFLTHALEWFGVQCEPTLSPWDKGRLLADSVCREATLLILDGIEPLQYPPGPMGGQLRSPGVQSLLKQLARKSSALNSQPSILNQALCLITTREPLTDLADFQRRPDAALGSVLRVDLGNLTEEAGAALLHHAGAKRAGAAKIKADDTELLAASREVNGHALTLNLMGRFLARAHGGDIRHRDMVKFEEADRMEQGGTTFKMLAAFESWFSSEGDVEARALAILRLMGLFDRPADKSCMDALREFPVIEGLTDPFFIQRHDKNGRRTEASKISELAWNNAIYFLADFELLAVEPHPRKEELLLNVHPLLREYFARELCLRQPHVWCAAHRRLYLFFFEFAPDSTRYFDTNAFMAILGLGEDDEQIGPTIEDLEPLYRAVTHGCNAGLQEEARVAVYRDRIQCGPLGHSAKKLCALESDLQAIACFFEQPWTLLSSGISESGRGWLMNEAGWTLFALGRANEAIVPMQRALENCVTLQKWEDAAVSASNLSEVELAIGFIDRAVRDAEQSVAISTRSGRRSLRFSGSHAALGESFCQSGRLHEAEEAFQRAEAIQTRHLPKHPRLLSPGGFAYCDLLLCTSERMAWRVTLQLPFHESVSGLIGACREVSARAATTLKAEEKDGFSALSIALDRLTVARASFFQALIGRTSLCYCSEMICEALDALRHANHADDLVRGMLAVAWLHAIEGNLENAQMDLDEAWDIAERGPMRLHMADIHLYRARLFGRPNDERRMTKYPWESPAADLAAAEKLIQAFGYHRRDEELSDAKAAILSR